MSKFVITSHDKGIEFVLRVQMGIFIINTIDLIGNSHFILSRFFCLDILLQDKVDIIRMIEHFGNSYLKKSSYIF